jgi:hypothetical protein
MSVLLLIVTILSLAIALATSAIAWRVVRDERQRSAARVAALETDIYADISGDGPPQVVPRPRLQPRSATATSRSAVAAAVYSREPEVADLQLRPERPSSVDLFAAQVTRPRSRLSAIIALALFITGCAAALAVVLGSASRERVEPPRTSVATSTAETPAGTEAIVQAAPLELVALGQEREADRLTVRGVVRNPQSGQEGRNIAVVVFVFGHGGESVATGRAPIAAPVLAPGGESTFLVVVPGVSDVERYRVSFKSDDRVLPHVDRRSKT